MAYESYWSNCKLALRFNGENASQTFVDDVGLSTLTAVDTAALSTAHYDSAPTGLYLDGNYSGKPHIIVSSPDSVTDFGSGALTIAFSFRLSSVSPRQNLIDCYANGQPGFNIRVYDGSLICSGGAWAIGNLSLVAYPVAADVMHRAMLVRNGSGQWRLLLDGLHVDSFTQFATPENFGGTAMGLRIGAAVDGRYSVADGYVDEIYFVHGVALEWDNYTPAPIFDGVSSGPSTGSPALPLWVTVRWFGAPALPVSVSVGQSGTVSLGLAVSVIDPAFLSGVSLAADGAGNAARWAPVVEIDGIDVSNDLVGPVEVEGSEGDARVAHFTLAVAPGSVVRMPDYVGRAVRIDIADGNGNNRLRLFTGRLDLPDLDLSACTVRCACTDDLQNRLAAVTTAYLDGLIGGRWSPAVFAKGAGSWRYAQDQISTVPASLDISADGQLRVTPWLAKSTPDLDFDADDVIDGSLSVDFAERSALVNQVGVEFGYRFPRLKSEGYHIDFSYVTNGFSAWVNAGNGFLFRSAVSAAIEHAGGSIVSITWRPLPTTAQVVGGGFWLPNPATDPLMCLGFEAVVSFDYTQDVDELHAIRVHNPSSIAAVGLIAERMSGALAGVALDNAAAETGILLYKNQISKIPPPVSPPVVSGATNAAAIPLTLETDRAAANLAMETLIDVAKVKIAASHRSSRLAAALPLNPLVDVDKTLRVQCDGVVAKGKCVYFRHTMDADAGRATTDFSLALCSLSGLGIADAGDVTAAPPGTADGVTSSLADPVCVYNGLAGQDQSFTVTFPAVAASERNAAVVNLGSDVVAPLVEDVLTINL